MKRHGEEAAALESGAVELGVELDRTRTERLLAYLELLYAWNRNIGLTTVPREKAVRLHLLDSLSASALVEAGPCLDLGSGAGLPGLVLAIARPDLEFTLLDSSRRRCSFLLEARRRLLVSNVRVVEGDAGSAMTTGSFPVVLSRAFRPPREFLAIGRRFVAEGGCIVLMGSDLGDPELEALSRDSGLGVDRVLRLRLPGGPESRTLVRWKVG